MPNLIGNSGTDAEIPTYVQLLHSQKCTAVQFRSFINENEGKCEAKIKEPYSDLLLQINCKPTLRMHVRILHTHWIKSEEFMKHFPM